MLFANESLGNVLVHVSLPYSKKSNNKFFITVFKVGSFEGDLLNLFVFKH